MCSNHRRLVEPVLPAGGIIVLSETPAALLIKRGNFAETNQHLGAEGPFFKLACNGPSWLACKRPRGSRYITRSYVSLDPSRLRVLPQLLLPHHFLFLLVISSRIRLNGTSGVKEQFQAESPRKFLPRFPVTFMLILSITPPLLAQYGKSWLPTRPTYLKSLSRRDFTRNEARSVTLCVFDYHARISSHPPLYPRALVIL